MKHRVIKRVIYMLSIALSGVSCIDKTYFGESSEANIITFTIQGEMRNNIEPLEDWNDVGTVDITVPSSFDLANLKVTNVVCSQLAHFTTVPETLTDFTKPVELWVVAENNSIKKRWVVTVTKQPIEAQEQLPFSDMKRWTPAFNQQGQAVVITDKKTGTVKTGYFPGNGTDYSPWQSSIEGNSIALSGLTNFSVVPNTDHQTADYARLITLETVTGSLMGTGVATGGLFTGQFVMNAGLVIGTVKEPRKMMNVGVPFYGRPKSVEFEVRYKAGAKMVDGKLKPILEGTGKPTKDSCDIFFALQNRLSEPGTYIRVATAALRSPAIGNMDDENGFQTITLPFVYGAPTAEQIAQKPYIRIGGAQGEIFFHTFTKDGDKWDISAQKVREIYAADPENTTVDNLIVMFTSSTYGDLFYAAAGSTLDVKNIKLIY